MSISLILNLSNDTENNDSFKSLPKIKFKSELEKDYNQIIDQAMES